MIRNFLAGTALVVGSFSTIAAPISFNGYTLNESKNIVTGGGLEWIQWDETIGMSVDSAIFDIADGVLNNNDYGMGWKVASNRQMAELFNTFGFGFSRSWDFEENTTQSTSDTNGYVENLSDDPEKQFVNLFGNTWTDLHGNEGSNDPLEYSAAFFGLDKDNDGLFNSARIFDDYIYQNNIDHWGGLAELFSDHFSSETINGVGGVALIREVNPANNVTEPSTFAVVLLGLMGMVRLNRKTSNK